MLDAINERQFFTSGAHCSTDHTELAEAAFRPKERQARMYTKLALFSRAASTLLPAPCR